MTVSYQSKLQDDYFPFPVTSCLALQDSGIIFFKYADDWGKQPIRSNFPAFGTIVVIKKGEGGEGSMETPRI